MGSKYVICHEQNYPGGPKCSALFTADNEKDLLEAAGRHGINVHGHANTESYREQICKLIKDGAPPR